MERTSSRHLLELSLAFSQRDCNVNRDLGMRLTSFDFPQAMMTPGFQPVSRRVPLGLSR